MTMETGQVVAIPVKVQACINAIKESLESHRELARVKSDKIHDVAVRICNTFDIRSIAFFVTITHLCMGVGRFCLIHNHKVDDYILSESPGAIDDLLVWIRQGNLMCVEVFKNPHLDPEDLAIIEHHLVQEFNTVHSAILNYTEQGYGEKIMPCRDGRNSLVESCHGTVCQASGYDPVPLDVNRKIDIIDTVRGSYLPTLFSYDVLDLVHDLLPDQPEARINRFSKLPFAQDLSQDLCKKYSRERAMVRRYHQWGSEPI
jgi:hypothetical protein